MKEKDLIRGITYDHDLPEKDGLCKGVFMMRV